MTQYLMSVWHAPMTEAETKAYEATGAFEDTGKFNDKLIATGHFVFAGGLHTPDSATVVRATGDGDVVVTDGPFAEVKENLGGFWIIEAADLDEALALAK
ncbi:MAG TPA: YciI family protein, partial [Acidimicrobiales bacterium]|nr:YciI family protein [Acidimicrobiales bacterium]